MADGEREGGNRSQGVLVAVAQAVPSGTSRQQLLLGDSAGHIGGACGHQAALEVPGPYSSSYRYLTYSESTGASPAAATGRYAAVPVTHAGTPASGGYTQVLACSTCALV